MEPCRTVFPIWRERPAGALGLGFFHDFPFVDHFDYLLFTVKRLCVEAGAAAVIFRRPDAVSAFPTRNARSRLTWIFYTGTAECNPPCQINDLGIESPPCPARGRCWNARCAPRSSSRRGAFPLSHRRQPYPPEVLTDVVGSFPRIARRGQLSAGSELRARAVSPTLMAEMHSAD